MDDEPSLSASKSFETDAPVGRLFLLLGSYAPMLSILGLRLNLDTLGLWLFIAGAAGSLLWFTVLFRWSWHRPMWDLQVDSAEPLDRDAAAYVASYLLPILAAKPDAATGYLAYALAALLILTVAYRADLGAVNPLAYLAGCRAYRVAADGKATIVISRSYISRSETWRVQGAFGLTVARKLVSKESQGE